MTPFQKTRVEVSERDCTRCKGTGYVRTMTTQEKLDCPTCKGSGGFIVTTSYYGETESIVFKKGDWRNER